MDSQQARLASFKYKHGSRISLTGKRKIAFVISLFGALVVAKLIFPFGLLALLVPAMIYLAGGRTLMIGPRYFICGDQIIYYANVTELKLSEAEGTLSVQTGKAIPFVIERERFPTSARKKAKIAANKAAKFNKVTTRIIEKVRRASPTVAGKAGAGH